MERCEGKERRQREGQRQLLKETGKKQGEEGHEIIRKRNQKCARVADIIVEVLCRVHLKEHY